MKYLEHLGLENISKIINNTEFSGGRCLHGRVEIYSTKKAKDDKKHSKLIQSKLASTDLQNLSFPIASGGPAQIFQSSVTPSPPRDSLAGEGKDSPARDAKKTQKMLVDLIQTLNAAQLDHDFSELSPDCFEIVSLEDSTTHINSYLGDLVPKHPLFLSLLWKEIDSALSGMLSQCEVFRLSDATIADDIDDGITSSFHYFFCNKELKRLCYFHCNTTCRYRTCSSCNLEEDIEGEEEMEIGQTQTHSGEEDDDDDDAYGWN